MHGDYPLSNNSHLPPGPARDLTAAIAVDLPTVAQPPADVLAGKVVKPILRF
jgi:hypothetical protein